MANKSDLPTFYIYQESGKWRRTDEQLTHDLNFKPTVGADWLADRIFYPQWPEPRFKSKIRPAWCINSDGCRAVRCREIECDHDRTHYNCEILGNGKCLRTQAIMLEWDSNRQLWVQRQSEQST